jgi:hypothetical protein
MGGPSLSPYACAIRGQLPDSPAGVSRPVRKADRCGLRLPRAILPNTRPQVHKQLDKFLNDMTACTQLFWHNKVWQPPDKPPAGGTLGSGRLRP